jgi:chromosome segregation protein
MYLSKLEVFGFKSFAHKVSFQFNDGITAIIGPNGCGKSNIVDSIRWVLGEQRPTLLRLDKMENLIFNGTAVRKPLSMVEVSLLIENTKNILPSVYSEVKITRRFYRSGESEFLLNNRLVRLKDIIDLFADTGMGSDAYSVIELKMVEQILSENAEERRRLFEEAAGIKKYKFRRKSALRKLETTEQELLRLNDIIAEVQKTVNSLSRQVGKARRYHQFKDELFQKELYIYQIRKKHYEGDLIPLREEYNQVHQTRERLGKEVTQDEAELEKLQAKAVDLENQFRRVSAHLNDLDIQVRDIQQKVQLNEQKIESSRENISEREKEIHKLQLRIEEHRSQLTAVEQEKDQENLLLSAAETEFQKQQSEQQKAEEDLATARKGFQGFRELNLLQLREIGQEKEEFQKTAIEKENQLQQLEKLNKLKSSLEAESEIREQKFKQVGLDFNKAQEQLELNEQELRLLKGEILELEEETSSLENDRNSLLGQLEKSQSHRDFLKGLIENYEGFSDSVQHLMSQRKNYRGIIDTLANLVDTSDQYRRALESYLEIVANYLVVEETEAAREIFRDLEQQKKGRLTLLPLPLITPEEQKPSDVPALNGEAVFLKEVVQYDHRYEKLFQLLFNRILIVSDLDTALKFHQDWPDYQFLTYSGDMIGSWGEISSGNSQPKFNLTGRRTEYEALQKTSEQLQTLLQQNENKIDQQRQRLQKKRERLQEIENLQQDYQKNYSSLEQQYHQEKYENDRLAERLTEIVTEIHQLTARVDELKNKEQLLQPVVLSADTKQQNLQAEEARQSKDLEESERRFSKVFQQTQQIQINYLNKQSILKELQQKIEFLKRSEQEIRERTTEAQQEISNFLALIENIHSENLTLQTDLDQRYRQRDDIEKEKLEVENNYQSLKSLILSREEEIKKLHRRWNQSLERLKELELKIQEIEIKLSTQHEQYLEQHGEEFERLLQENPLPENQTVVQLQEEIQKLRQSIEALGEVNPLAVKEFDREKERLDFLKTQQADLLEAKSELNETINKLNKTARQLFLDTFEKINDNFKSVFGKFFEGGQAELQLIENSDPLEANIDISVHIKGKRLTTLNLMSAGEKTLTAISLLFAIYLYKPSPFCILDEVDAPLDDVNISRYTHALKEFSQNTQFILVTHNKMTMQAAQAMYGITMEEPGVSKVVSVRFN